MDRGRGRGGGRGGRGSRGGRGGGGGDVVTGFQRMNIDSGGRGRGGDRGGRGRGDRGGRGGRGRGRGAPRPERPVSYDVVLTRPENLDKKGTSGTPLPLMTNYVGFKKRPDSCLFKYRVDFKCKHEGELETYVKKNVFKRLRAQLPIFLFDGTICYLRSKIDKTKFTSACEMRGSAQDVPVEVELRLVNELHPTDNDYVHFHNMIKQEAIEQLGLKQFKANFYDPVAAIHKPEWQISIWPGYKTTIRQHEHELLMGCEISHKILRTDSALSTIKQIQQRIQGADQQVRAMKRALIGAIVISNYDNRTYRIDDIDFKSNPKTTFNKKDGSSISFIDYYKERWSITIKDHGQPLLISMPKDKDKRRGDAKPVKMIPELAQMTGFTDQQRQNFKMMNALSEWTRMGPEKRVEAICKFTKRMTSTPEVARVFENWGMQLEHEPKALSGRVLNPETVYLKKEVHYKLHNADWTNSLKEGMLESKSIQKLAVVVPKQFNDQAQTFWKKCRDIAPSLNILFADPFWLQIPDMNTTTYTSAIERQVYPKGPHLVLVFIPKVEEEKYAALKKLMLIKCPMINQLVTQNRILSKYDKYASFATKIVVQMAVKLGAKPWAVKIPPKNVMVAGFDTYHKKEGDRQGKSFGAFTASLDEHFSRYFSLCLAHSAGEEISQNIATMFTGALRAYHTVNGHFPARVIFYRDGVGEGQLQEVHETEIKSIKRVLETLGEDIKLTFIIVSKRINTRFFTNAPGQPKQNPPSGTVVDDVATLPERYDFYLISQSVGQGTVNPTSYNIILDESGWPPDRLQVLTYKLTHLYYNWPGTVRVPAPCRYAHKLADLVGGSLKEEVHPDLTSKYVLYYL